MPIPFISWVIQGIPECIAVSVFIASMTGKFKFKPVIVIGLIQAVIAYLIRLLPLVPFGHMFILIFTFGILFQILYKTNIFKGLLYAILAATIIALTELGTYFCLEKLNIFTLADAVKNSINRALTGWPQIIILTTIALFNIKRKRMLKKINQNEDISAINHTRKVLV